RTLLWKIKNWKFKQVFGFVPTPQYGGRTAVILEQAFVDAQLSALASDYRMADRNEQRAISLLRQVHNSGLVRAHSSGELIRAKSNAEWCQRELHLEKSAFWHAHGLTKKAGFIVKDKYTDYLRDDLL
ncbi:MAG: hypothetical protein Q8P04_01135, partial [bacterium]|nr:hypothetical protein [bacterium]